jgi:hypothetical protein
MTVKEIAKVTDGKIVCCESKLPDVIDYAVDFEIADGKISKVIKESGPAFPIF